MQLDRKPSPEGRQSPKRVTRSEWAISRELRKSTPAVPHADHTARDVSRKSRSWLRRWWFA